MFSLLTLGLMVVLLSLVVPTSPASAETSEVGCTQTSNEPFTFSCTLMANNYSSFYDEPTDLVSPLQDPDKDPLYITDIGHRTYTNPDYDGPPIAASNVSSNTDDAYPEYDGQYATLFIFPDVTENFQFNVTYSNGTDALVIVDVIPYVPPAQGKVVKTKRKGFIRACVPGKPKNDKAYVILFGNQSEPEPDDKANIAAGTCKRLRVHRKEIYYVMFVRRTGEFVQEGTVKGIKLPKGDPGIPDDGQLTPTGKRATPKWRSLI